MWEADKIYYNGEDDFVRAFQGGKIIWSKVQELVLFTESDGLTYNGVELVPNQPNYVPVPTDRLMPKIPKGVTEVYWRNYDNRKNNIKFLSFLNDENTALITFDAEGSNFEGITSMSYMFDRCSNLTTISHLDTSNVTNMSNMFQYCQLLTTFPQLDTSNVTNISGMFSDCVNLVTVPQLDTSNVTNMSEMFNCCIKLTTIPQLDTSNVTNISYMFSQCRCLVSIPHLDTSNVTNMEWMFWSCYNLVTVPQLDTSNVTNMKAMFIGCYSLENVGGFIGLKVDLNMSECPLTLESVYNIANNAAVVTEGQTITFSEHTHSLLTDEVIGIFTSKGWTIN